MPSLDSLKEMAEVVRKVLAKLAQLLRRVVPTEEIRSQQAQLFRRLVFDILMDNTDDHEKKPCPAMAAGWPLPAFAGIRCRSQRAWPGLSGDAGRRPGYPIHAGQRAVTGAPVRAQGGRGARSPAR